MTIIKTRCEDGDGTDVPGTLVKGELAVNTQSAKLWVGDGSGVVPLVTGAEVPETRTLTAGAGLTGGGDLSANRTFNVGAGTGITVNANDVALDTADSRNVNHASVSMIAGSGLTGGGTIAANRTFNVGAGTGITVAADTVSLNTTYTDGRYLLNTTDTLTGNLTVTGWGRFGNGSPAAPTVSFGSDPDIGMYRIAANTLGFSTTGVERMRIISTGAVGIGLGGVNPKTAFHVSSGVSNLTYTPVNSTATFERNGVGGIDIVGNPTNSINLNFSTFTTQAEARLRHYGSNGVLEILAKSTLTFRANGVEVGRISSAGDWLIGDDAFGSGSGNSFVCSQAGTINTERDNTNNQRHHGYFNANGLVGTVATNGAATNYNTTSDVRLKEHIADALDPFTKLNAIKVRQFDWKKSGTHQDYGFIAQELIEVAPEAVSVGETKDEIWGVDPSKLVPLLIKTVQELAARVEALEA